ncbi:hypothetical protein QP64_00140, partial [Staphylococcus aureus]
MSAGPTTLRAASPGTPSSCAASGCNAADPHQRPVRIAHREFVAAPGLQAGPFLLEDQLPHPIRHAIDIVGVEIDAERIVPRHQPAEHCLVEVEMPALAVVQDLVVTIVADQPEAQPR